MNKFKLLFISVFLLSTTTVVSQSPYIPQDFNNEPAIPAHSYWRSDGQILDMEGSVVEELRYYTMGTGPKVFVFDDKVSFVHYYTDTIVSDTAWRLDMQFVCDSDYAGEGNETSSLSPDDPPSPDEPCGTLSANEQDEGHLNYYLQHTGAGLEGVNGYHRIVYENAWPNIDFHLYSNRIGIKFYIVVQPGGDPNNILFKFTGQDNITTPAPGAVKMHLASRSVQFPQAFAWQENGAGGTPTALMWLPTWNLTGSNNDMISVSTGSYDTSEPLVIQLGGDPNQGLATDDPNDNSNWSSYMGDNMDDFAEGLDTDNDGNVYMGGSTESAHFPVSSGQSFFNNDGGADVFTAKFRKENRMHLWTTIVGGTTNDILHGLDHNGDDKVYVTGVTNSSTMIPGGGFNNQGNYKHASHGNEDGFLIRMKDNSGQAEWITHFGGAGNDGFYDVYADATNIYLAGAAISTNVSQTCGVPGSNALALCDPGGSAYFQDIHGGGVLDALIVRFNNTGNLTYSTYLGGDEYDIAYTIGIDANGKVVVAGNSEGGGVPSNVSSPCGVPATGEFPLCDMGGSSYYQDDQPSAFIIRLDAGLQLTQGTYFGTNSSIVTDLTFNSDNHLFVVGNLSMSNTTTNTCTAPGSNSFPVCASGSEYSETHDGENTRYNSFIARFNGSGAMLWSTPYGEDSYNLGSPAVAIDDDDNVYMVSTLKHDPANPPNDLFPGQYFPGYYQQWEVQNPNQYDQDATLVAFDVNNERQWATVFGGDTASGNSNVDRNDVGQTIATYGAEDLFIGGRAASVNLYQACPVPGTSYCQAVLSDLTDDAFVTQFNIEWLVTQVEERKAKQDMLEAYPNPVNDQLTIKLPESWTETVAIRAYSMDGRLMISTTVKGNGSSISISVIDLHQGVYLLQASNRDISKSTRFVKQ